ncbi:MAG: rRNA maturation RNase YbeY [Pseudomonadota bacterium]
MTPGALELSDAEGGDSPVDIDVAEARWRADIPNLETFVERCLAAARAAEERIAVGAVSLSFTDDAAIAALNKTWRGKDRPTNVLSFPAAPMPGPHPPHLGDIAIAYETVKREADAGDLSVKAHTAHMIVHGALHLAGHDHIDDKEADAMEALETRILARLGYNNPYRGDPGPAGIGETNEH